MGYYDPNKEYGKGAFGDFMDAGASKKGSTIAAQQADMNTLVNELAVNMQEKTGAVTAEEAEAMREAGAEQVQADYDENMGRVRSLSTWNTVTNTAGIVTSVVAAAGVVAKGVSAGTKAANAAATAAGAAGKAGLFKTGASVVSAVTKHGALKAVGIAAPAVGARILTNSWTDAEVSRMQQTYNSLEASYKYLTSEDKTLTEAMKDDMSEWTTYHAQGMQSLQDKLSSGEMTQAEYDAAYAAFMQESQAKYDETMAQHAETAKYVTENGVAYATDQHIVTHGYNIDDVNERCQYIADLNTSNPNAYEAAKSAEATMKKLDTGSSFGNFLANMNATILHYVPGMAYVEAAVVKGADMLLDFASDIPVVSSFLNYDEKHKGESVSDIAKDLCDRAEERYDLTHAVNEAVGDLKAGAEAPQSTSSPEEILQGELQDCTDKGGQELAPSMA